MRDINSKKYILVVLISILLIIILGLGVYGYSEVLNTELIYEGVRIGQYDISFMSREEALYFIKNIKEKELRQKSMRLIYIDKEYEYSLKELGFHYNYEDAIIRAYSVGRTGSIFNRIKDIFKARKNGAEVVLDSGIDVDSINRNIKTVVDDIEKEAKDAIFYFNNGKITITDEIVGKVVDQDRLLKAIQENIYALDDLHIPVDSITPQITSDLLGRINGIIGEFSTSFKDSSANRIENIRLSSNSIKGKMLMPGESMSFNELTGPREGKSGYREASVIIAGEFTPAIGGGVCQTSTTFYNALLLADVTILERSPHSIPAKYVAFGQDAAVAFGLLDLKFRNDFDFPIYFDSKLIGDRLYFYVYGDKQSRDYSVKIESVILETVPYKEEIVIDKTLEPGSRILKQEGRNGYKVNTYKSVIKNGKTISKDLINRDYYRPRNFIYMVGEEAATVTSTDLVEPIDSKFEINNESEKIEY